MVSADGAPHGAATAAADAHTATTATTSCYAGHGGHDGTAGHVRALLGAVSLGRRAVSFDIRIVGRCGWRVISRLANEGPEMLSQTSQMLCIPPRIWKSFPLTAVGRQAADWLHSWRFSFLGTWTVGHFISLSDDYCVFHGLETFVWFVCTGL